MTKFAILHQDLEWAEQTLQRYIVLKGHEAILVDLNDADNVDFTLFDVVLNRVYASVANRITCVLSTCWSGWRRRGLSVSTPILPPWLITVSISLHARCLKPVYRHRKPLY